MILKNVGCLVAAKAAGYPDPEGCADILYEEFGEMLNAYRKQNDTDYNLVLSVYRAAAVAETTSIDMDEDDNKIAVKVPEHRTRMSGAKGLCEIFGFNAATETRVTSVNELPPDIEEIFDRVNSKRKN